MGDQLRFDPTQPRELAEADRRADGQPKVVVNPAERRVSAPAKFEPPVPAESLGKALAALDARSGTQRGKPRSQDLAKNPLGCRVFDCACGWPMYRQPYKGSFRYSCGLYQQSHGAECAHNTVDGTRATRLVLGCVRQRVLAAGPGLRERLRAKLEELARRDQSRPDPAQEERLALERSLGEVRQKRERAEENLTLATSDDQYRAVSKGYEKLLREERELEESLQALSHSPAQPEEPSQVEAALAAFDRVAELAEEPGNLGAVGELFDRLNARLFLRFGVSRWGKREVNRVSGGVVTFGSAAPPVTLYEGPTGRRALKGRSEPGADGALRLAGSKQNHQTPGGEGGSLGNVSRADWI
jgi:hypothetical protein